jgi:hypothetical protein
MQPPPHRIGLHADADQVIRGETVKSLLARNSHTVSLRLS